MSNCKLKFFTAAATLLTLFGTMASPSLAGSNKSKVQNTSPSHRVHDLRSAKVHSFQVNKSHLGKGTETTKTTRNHVNNQGTSRPHRVSASWKAGQSKGHTAFTNKHSKTNDAGHILAKSNGGKGHTTNGVFPQNPKINRGNRLNGAQTHSVWRGHENKFNKAVKKSGNGNWTVKLHRK